MALGTIVHVSLGMTLVTGDDGAPAGVSTVARDITDRVYAAAALRAAAASFRLAFDESPIGMALISLDGRFMRVNDALVTITGHAREELEGRKVESLADPDDIASDADAVRELVAGERTTVETERRYVHAGGHPIWIALSATCIRDGHGTPTHVLGHIRDITDRRRFEQRLQHMADHDLLTGLLNRRAFERELAGQVDRNERYGVEGAVLIIDIDHFKYCNDTLGHRAGDECSCASRTCCKSACGRRMGSRVSAATSSPFCCRARASRRHARSPRCSCRPSAKRPACPCTATATS